MHAQDKATGPLIYLVEAWLTSRRGLVLDGLVLSFYPTQLWPDLERSLKIGSSYPKAAFRTLNLLHLA